MSYSIFLDNEGDDSFIFPFCGNITFNQFWKRMIDKFDLKMINFFNVNFDDLMYQDFLKELDLVKNCLKRLPDDEDNDKGQLERLYFVLETLDEKKSKYKYIMIG